jgi:hypothetical protein
MNASDLRIQLEIFLYIFIVVGDLVVFFLTIETLNSHNSLLYNKLRLFHRDSTLKPSL